MAEKYRSLGAVLLRRVRTKAKQTPYKFGAEIGVQPAMINGWERGDWLPNLRNGILLEDKFSIPVRAWMEKI